MSNERYPQNLVVSAQNFTESGWKDATTQASREGYSAMWQALTFNKWWNAAHKNQLQEDANEVG